MKKLAQSCFNSDNYPFHSNEDKTERLQVFSNLLCGFTVDISSLSTQLSSIGIECNPQTTPCTILSFHINNFSDYILKTYKHEPTKLYNAISYLAPFETTYAYYSLSRYSHSNVDWIMIYKNKEYDEKLITSFSDDLINKMKDILKIDASLNFYDTYTSISDLLRQNEITEENPNVPANYTIKNALDYMNSHYNENITLEDVSNHVFMSSVYFSAYFKSKTNQRFIDCLVDIKLKKAAELLTNSTLSTATVCDMIGYKNFGHFHDTFKKRYGMTPSEYKKKHAR